MRIGLAIISVAYPVIVYLLLTRFELNPRLFSLLLVALASGYFLRRTDKKSGLSPLIPPLTALILALVIFLTRERDFIKWYPIGVSLFFLSTFLSTLFHPPSFVYRIAILHEKEGLEEEQKERMMRYCLKVTYVWIAFFCLNITLSTLTLFLSDEGWVLYNGFISYALMGAIFAGEWLVRKRVKKRVA